MNVSLAHLPSECRA